MSLSETHAAASIFAAEISLDDLHDGVLSHIKTTSQLMRATERIEHLADQAAASEDLNLPQVLALVGGLVVSVWLYREFMRVGKMMDELDDIAKRVSLWLAGHGIERTPNEVADALLLQSEGESELAIMHGERYLEGEFEIERIRMWLDLMDQSST